MREAMGDLTDPPATPISVGGLVDRTGVCVAVYGEHLDPDDVTSIIGRPPTSAHRKGDRRGPRSPPLKRGAWFFELRGKAPEGPAELTARLLDQLPDDEPRLGEAQRALRGPAPIRHPHDRMEPRIRPPPGSCCTHRQAPSHGHVRHLRPRRRRRGGERERPRRDAW